MSEIRLIISLFRKKAKEIKAQTKGGEVETLRLFFRTA
jgi:hypothetical protein